MNRETALHVSERDRIDMANQRSTITERLAVSVEDAAAMAGVGRTTVYLALGDGSLPSLKIGKRRLIRVEALRAWIASHETGDRGTAA